MIEFIKSISEKEIKFISKLDCKQDVERHKEALNKVIFDQAGVIGESQVWFPYEVIELGANALVQGHEKEFTVCTLLVLLNAPDEKKALFDAQAKSHELLPQKYQELIFEAMGK